MIADMKIREIKKPEACCASSSCCASPASQVLPQSGKPFAQPEESPPCCGPAVTVRGGEIDEHVPGFIGWMPTPAGPVPHIATTLARADHVGACKARWGIGRMNYIVPPGLYAVGMPDSGSPVLVTANYKMSYDLVRSSLAGRNVWLLVLETFGVNVWCAAGKGTFGTGELVERIEKSGLSRVVEHRNLILPILGAPGVAAHQVTRHTGFRVMYGTIRAADIPQYLDNGMVTTESMRTMTFSFYERLVLVPVEIVLALKTNLLISAGLFAAGWLAGGLEAGVTLLLIWLGAMLTGVAVGPLLLPWLPGRSFAVKGACAGALFSLLCYLLAGGRNWGMPETVALFLSVPAISGFYTLNFTGCTTYTSPSGVRKEMRRALPLMGGAVLLSGVLLIIGLFG